MNKSNKKPVITVLLIVIVYIGTVSILAYGVVSWYYWYSTIREAKYEIEGSEKIFQDRQIYNDVRRSFGLMGLNVNDFDFFFIWGKDRVSYRISRDDLTTTDRANYTYKTNGSWKLVQSDTQPEVNCNSLETIAEKYRPPCLDSSGKELYIRYFSDGLKDSINYSWVAEDLIIMKGGEIQT